MESVDEALNEVRPYLIADGGNVAVKDVNAETQTVYLQLEGACGSCPSSTVTMQMGVERVLKENFGPDVRVEQVDDGPAAPTSLTMDMVEDEVNRIKPAILAMGGVVRIVSVDAATGVVQLNFRGASRVQQGLELAIRDLPLVNAVQFVMGDE
jgi:Fe-S cluster biogenesis protein NfuA